MKNLLRDIFVFILFCLILIPSEAICVVSAAQNIPSLDYIVTKKHAEITLIQGEEDYYVVSQNSSNSEITNANKNDKSDVIFGEDAITEDNILKHYIFSRNRLNKNHAYNNLTPNLKNTFNSKAP